MLVAITSLMNVLACTEITRLAWRQKIGR